MIYFKYKVSFKKVKDLDKLLKDKKITRIYNENEFKKHQLKSDDIYCFIDPYCEVIDNEIILNWELSNEDAMETFYISQEEI